MLREKLHRYRILREIGAGGMGVVYRARDERLRRDVALKLLPPGTLTDENARTRVLQEAVALSKLNHPNICTIYGLGEVESQTYIVMELVKGRSLMKLVRGKGLAARTVTRYGTQIADALSHAHKRGLVHRDLKSSNLMVTSDGVVKLLDFGLARRRREPRIQGATQAPAPVVDADTVVGTVYYMAPELLDGGRADAGSDIWALGVVLYEMATGRLPFEGKTALAVNNAILKESPAPLPRSVPARLREVIQRCLAKDPAQRYQTAAEARAALAEGSKGTAGLIEALLRPTTRRWVLGALALAALIAVPYWLDVNEMRERVLGILGTPHIKSLAVLPLDNLSPDPDQEFLANGMTEQLITDLSKIGALRVISWRSAMKYKGMKKPVREIARELNVDAVVQGGVLRSGNRVRVTAELFYVPKDSPLWADSFDRGLPDVLALQDEVARSIAARISITLTAQEEARLGVKRPVDPEAFQLYLRGRDSANQGSLDDVKDGIALFKRAIGEDPSFAPAHAGLASAYIGLASISAAPREVMPNAKAEALQALKLDEGLSEAHTDLADVQMFYEWDWSGAEKELQRAIELDPNSAQAHHLYGLYFMALSRQQEAGRELERARELDPLSLPIAGDLLRASIAARRYDQAIDEARRVLAANPDFALANAWLGIAYAQEKHYPEAIAALEKARSLDPSYTMDHFLAIVLAAAGNKDEAQKLASKLEDLARHQYVCAYEVASVYVALGDSEAAYKWMQKGVDERSGCLVWLKSDPWMDPLRAEPRYLELVKQVFGDR